MKPVRVLLWFTALSGLLAGCTAAPVTDSSEYLGGTEPSPDEGVCEPVHERAILRLDTEAQVGTLTVSNDASGVTVQGAGMQGWEFTRFDLFIRTDNFQDQFYASYDPSQASAEMSFGYDLLQIGCGGEYKVYLNGDMTDGTETVTVSALGTYEWPARGGWYEFFEVCCFEEPSGCTLTQGFWKTHPDAWPVDQLIIGGQSYGQEELLELLWTPTRGDASLIIGHQLIAALLNAASGASTADDLAAAQAWMADNADADGRLPYGLRGGDTSLGDALAAYNEGVSGPGHCDESSEEVE